MCDNWPWDQPPNCIVFTLREIIEDGGPILYVSHDLDDHGWQFLNLGEFKTENAMLVALSSIVEIDPTVELHSPTCHQAGTPGENRQIMNGTASLPSCQRRTRYARTCRQRRARRKS